jgi:DNA-binding NtrC family response regulator
MTMDVTAHSAKPRTLLYLQPPAVDESLLRAITNSGWSVDLAANAEEALDLMDQHRYSVGLMHLDEDNLDPGSVDRQAEKFINVNASGNLVALLSSVDAIHGPVAPIIARYFYDYHTRPVDTHRLLVTLGHAHGMAQVANANLEDFSVSALPCGRMMGKSPQMKMLVQKITRLAGTDFNVLIRGESGTGKELSAEAIHLMSDRAAGPFIPVNCGALPKDLIQAELFGHEKGAFTGADRRRVGKIESAQNGTLFLDEIGDLPLELQINLLRFLQERTIDRVGGSGQIPLNVRVIAATHVNLEKAVAEGRFREDLYYRLNVLQVEVPPLRERGSDIRLLAEYFFEKFANEVNPNLKGFSNPAISALEQHHWPGNVREMVNRIQRAVVMSESKLLSVRDLGLDQDVGCNLETLAQARSRAEKEVIEATLALVRNNVSKAARHLDISRVTLYRLMDTHAIDWQRTLE